MFLNGIYTDGDTCRVLFFCRKDKQSSSVNDIPLQLEDLDKDEVKKYFRPCTVDPGRKDVFASYHGANDIRRLSFAEYYDMGGNINQRQKLKLT